MPITEALEREINEGHERWKIEDAKRPIVITGPGEYRCRNGKRVTIHEIKYPPNYTAGCCAFSAKGSIWRKVIAMGLNPPYGIWRTTGQFRPDSEHPLDVVAKYFL